MGNIIQFKIEGSAFNGSRLKAARLIRGISSMELAEKTGLKRQTISMYENGKLDNPDFTTIQKLSEALKFPAKFFLEDLTISPAKSPIYFRSLLTTNKKYRLEQEEKSKFVATVCNMLSEYLNFKPLNLPELAPEIAPEEAARTLRAYWNLGDKPIEDIIYIVESNGMIVNDFETDTKDVDAYSRRIAMNNTYTYMIGYSRNKSTAARVHFDVAHELGHILLHSWKVNLEDIEKEEFKELEKQAHSFAAAFLMPKAEFSKDVALYPTDLSYYTELKKRWKVSIAAMIRRAADLKIISNDEYSKLMRKMQKKGIRKVEPLDNELVTASPALIRQAISLLLEHNVFSPSEIIEELSSHYGLTMYSTDLEELLGLKEGTLQEKTKAPILTLKPN